MKTFFTLLSVVFLASCNRQPKELSVAEKEEYVILGDKISSEAQMVLLSNVSQKIKESGTVGAVDFCNEKALVLTDSVANSYSKKIQRLTDRNRNPKNTIQSETDQKAWKSLQQNPENNPLVLQEGNSVYYYKSIPLGMPTCLMCHGNKQTDISPETLEIINLKYPQDQATDYKMGDLRGMWKIKVN